LALVVLWSTNSVVRTKASVPAAVLSFVVVLVLVPLSFLEHQRSIRPSPLICSYLILTTILDLAQLRTLWLIKVENTIAAVYTVSFSIKLLVLGLECIQKSRFLIQAEDVQRSPEDKSGVISLSLFFWMNRLVYTGYCKALSMRDLYPTPIDAQPQALEERLTVAWDKCKLLHLQSPFWILKSNSLTWSKASVASCYRTNPESANNSLYNPTIVHGGLYDLPATSDAPATQISE
jgi:ATP-binding cassette subfamily C (CFTR/MRP) protein 1